MPKGVVFLIVAISALLALSVGFRDYNPTDGAFHAVDPLTIDPSSATASSSEPSPYLYASNLPTRFVDPSGLSDGLPGSGGEVGGPGFIPPYASELEGLQRNLSLNHPGLDVASMTEAELAARAEADFLASTADESIVAARSCASTGASSAADRGGAGYPGIPTDWTSRPTRAGDGEIRQQPGSTGNANSVRIMDPTERYPNRYVRFYNQDNQPVDLNGKPAGRPETHIPRRPDGTYPVPMNWQPR